jgi:hypothetical protein
MTRASLSRCAGTGNDKIRSGLPRNIWKVPKGKIAIHNHIDHHVGQKSGEEGFRVWFDAPHDNYAECSCGWRPDLGTHYQVRIHYEGRT